MCESAMDSMLKVKSKFSGSATLIFRPGSMISLAATSKSFVRIVKTGRNLVNVGSSLGVQSKSKPSEV